MLLFSDAQSCLKSVFLQRFKGKENFNKELWIMSVNYLRSGKINNSLYVFIQ